MSVKDEVAELKKRRRSVKPQALHKLLKKAGFERRYGKGDHWVYKHELLDYLLTIDPRKPLLPVYVSKAIKAIEEVMDKNDG